MAPQPLHVHPTAPLAPRALLPGDPGRALQLAQELTDQPKMFNHNRGLWGYTGVAADGEPLTIMSHGMGGPSAAIVLEELCDLGVEAVVRIGTCGPLSPDVSLGDLIAADGVLVADGTSRALGADGVLRPDPGLLAVLAQHADVTGLIVSSDLFYDPDAGRPDAWRAAGALAVEMEAATILAVASRRGIRAACRVAVSDSIAGGGERIGGEALESVASRLGRAGLAALS